MLYVQDSKFKRFLKIKKKELFFVFAVCLLVINFPLLILGVVLATLISLFFEWLRFEKENG